jgi:hypothetical protein
MRKRTRPNSNEDTVSKKRRVCRFGAGVEITPDQCDTPGFPLRDKPQIVKDIRGFRRLETPRTNKRVTQTSAYMLQSWRANCDLQIFLYASDPQNPNLDEVASVTDYIVSYACKGNETNASAIQNLKNHVLHLDDNTVDTTTTTKLSRQILNATLKSKMISKQEATVNIAGLRLWTCSETIERVSLSSGYKLQKHGSAGKTAIISRYASRLKTCSASEQDRMQSFSLDQYFNYLRNTKTTSTKTVLPHYIGGHCSPVYPITVDYARSILLIYTPWIDVFPKYDNDEIMTVFENCRSNNILPKKVLLQIQRAKDQYITRAAWKEPTSEAKSYDYATFTEIDGSLSNEEAINIASTLPTSDDLMDDTNFNYGVHYPWDIPTCPLPDDIAQRAETFLDSVTMEHTQTTSKESTTSLPLKHDGTEYKLIDASDDQTQVLHFILDHLQKWFDPDTTDKPEPLRLVISGVAGSGKSTLTNTIVTTVRKMFRSTKSVKVVAPTGQAAFNAGGTTCHHGLGVGVNKKIQDGLTGSQLKELLLQNKDLVMLVFDERSLVSSKLLARCHYNICHTVYGGTNSTKDWGNIPILLFVGDDYQIPSVEPGCSSIFDSTCTPTDEEVLGNQLFLDLARKVVSLQASKRQHGTQTRFMRILRGLRCENPMVSHAFKFYSKYKCIASHHLPTRIPCPGKMQNLFVDIIFEIQITLNRHRLPKF